MDKLTQFRYKLATMVRRIRLKYIKEFGKFGPAVDKLVYGEIKLYLTEAREAFRDDEVLATWIDNYLYRDLQYADLPNKEQLLLDSLLNEMKLNSLTVDQWLRRQ